MLSIVNKRSVNYHATGTNCGEIPKHQLTAANIATAETLWEIEEHHVVDDAYGRAGGAERAHILADHQIGPGATQRPRNVDQVAAHEFRTDGGEIGPDVAADAGLVRAAQIMRRSSPGACRATAARRAFRIPVR
jgi:hypothetical protein